MDYIRRCITFPLRAYNKIIKLFRKHRWEYYRLKESKRLRKKLANQDFTLISQNCAGGYIYHQLGKRFDTPTINLYIYQSDFCKFCTDLTYYLDQNLRFFEPQKKVKCPYAHLGEGEKEITIQFTHYKTEEEARQKWEERKTRIHWNNMFIITNDGNGVTPEELNSLSKVENVKRIIVFTSQERPQIENSFRLKALKKYPTAVFMQTERHWWTGYRPWERVFNVSAWLNGENDFRK